MTLALPDHVLNETREYEQRLAMMAVLADETKHWTRELQEISPDLSLVWAPENVTHPALVPGRFHIIEATTPPLPPNVIPLVGENDSYREPGSWMFEMLRRNNHWSSIAVKERDKRLEAAQKAAERARAREAEERALELDERIKSMLNPGISMTNRGKGWTYRAPASHPKR